AGCVGGLALGALVLGVGVGEPVAAGSEAPRCAGTASETVVSLEASSSCRADELGLAERYCGAEPDGEVCAFLSTLPSDATMAFVVDGDQVCAAAVDRRGDRDFYAVATSPALRRLAADPRWQADPVALQSWDEGWMAFDPIGGCASCKASPARFDARDFLGYRWILAAFGYGY
ncbi:MAG TPA: hypothetical protein RMF84_20750, partial [Polyangiaceae bacterium LLY-WYZ-14_1]|nr:hypothetical protein [Polyangiaceae bacterium LLY-WYZ-14_1]